MSSRSLSHCWYLRIQISGIIFIFCRFFLCSFFSVSLHMCTVLVMSYQIHPYHSPTQSDTPQSFTHYCIYEVNAPHLQRWALFTVYSNCIVCVMPPATPGDKPPEHWGHSKGTHEPNKYSPVIPSSLCYWRPLSHQSALHLPKTYFEHQYPDSYIVQLPPPPPGVMNGLLV